YIKEFNLENIINFSYSVFQETGELLSQKKVNKLNAYLQYLLILGLFIIINFQMIFVSFTINSKKIALKKIFGYSPISQVLDLCLLPFTIELFATMCFQLIFSKNTY
ncbi:hypothetical protein CGC26_06705, partial [Enterococcus faecium]